MGLSKAKQKKADREAYCRLAYDKNDLSKEFTVTDLVKSLAKKFKVTEVQIYNDLKKTKAA